MIEMAMGRTPAGEWKWKNPPFGKDDEVVMEQWEDSPAVRSGPHPWGRGYGWLVEMQVPVSMAEGCKSHAEPRWIHVGGFKLASWVTVKDLCDAIQEHILGAMGFDPWLDVLPSNVGKWSLHDKIGFPSLLLADLRWTQGERLHLKEVKLPLRERRDFMPDFGKMTTAERLHEQARLESIGDRVVLFQRHSDRPKNLPTRRRLRDRLAELGVKIETRPQEAVPSDSVSGVRSLDLDHLEHASGASSSTGIWSRNLSNAEEDARANDLGELQRSRMGCCDCNSVSAEANEDADDTASLATFIASD